MACPYSILGLDSSASLDQVKSSYRKLAHQYHPDKQGSHDKFVELQIAYQLILDKIDTKAVTPNVTKVNITLEEAFRGGTFTQNRNTIRYVPGVRSGTKVAYNNSIYVFNVLPHSRFKRSNDDLLLEIDVSCFDIVAEKTYYVKHIDNSIIEIDLSGIEKSGHVIIYDGKGMPNPMFKNYGDLLVKINIVVPALTTIQKSAILKTLLNI